ncbi:MAG TPA: hypothetical protein VG028_07390 [Terriglobia bacterium]|nr:hypothetical protein [Terriglobia bacterium]
MNINRHGLRDHLQLAAPLFGVIAAVWALREISDAARAPHVVVHILSVTVAVPICVIMAVLLIHVRRFGGYANVVLTALLLVSWGQLLIVTAIAFSAFTGIETVYARPEYSFRDMSPWKHIVGHLTFGVGFGSLFAAAMGCLLLWMLRRLPADHVPAKHR